MDLETLAAAWRKRRAVAQAQLAERSSLAHETARRAARVLTDELGATRVWLFGSLVWGHPHAGSDLDLAVEGLAPERYFAALSRLDRRRGTGGSGADRVVRRVA